MELWQLRSVGRQTVSMSTFTATADLGPEYLTRVNSTLGLDPSSDNSEWRCPVTADDFRQVALSMPNALESAHMGHPDFRAGKKVFATLGYPDDNWGMVKLNPEQQEMLVAAEPGIFEPVKGAWGKSGATQVRLAALDSLTAASAIRMAWSNVAP